jgi:hypothetical protein
LGNGRRNSDSDERSIFSERDHQSDSGSLQSPRFRLEAVRGQQRPWQAAEYTVEFCPHPDKPCIDGCYFCGRPVGALNGDHNHTKVNLRGEPEAYSCVCESC